MATYAPGTTGQNVPNWWGSSFGGKPAGVSDQDYLTQWMINKAITYMRDPTSQAATAQYLARSSPTGYGAYAGVATPGPGAVHTSTAAQRNVLGQLTPGYFANLIQQIDPFAARPGLAVPKSSENEEADDKDYGIGKIGGPPEPDLGEAEAGAPGQRDPLGVLDKDAIEEAKKDPAIRAALDAMRNWLGEYLTTAEGARLGSTRAAQALAKGRLATLTKEAETASGTIGKMLPIAESLIHPVLGRAPQSGFLGTQRALTNPYGSYRRGDAAYRNPWAL